MVLNIPPGISTKDFLRVVDESGFAGTYDFCHLPRNLRTGRNSGYAFVNFTEAVFAQRLKDLWGGRKVFANRQRVKISDAKVTGTDACLRIADRSAKKKNAMFKPFVSL